MLSKMSLSLLAFFALTTVYSSTQHNRPSDKDMHHGNEIDPMRWRMPPHDFPMPPLPGLESAEPIVGPFLPGMGADTLKQFPEAQPNKVVEMKDGDHLELKASIVQRTLDGKTFLMYGYNGQYPGPLIKVNRNSTITVEFKNEIELPTTIHWHGLRLDNRFDGVPFVTQPPVHPGEHFIYEVYFPDTGVYWYHPHMREDIQQDLGLYGNMLVAPLELEYYNPVNQEQVLILDDILLDDLGPIPWGDRSPTHALMGRFGNVMLVNGTTEYGLEVDKGEVVRFYLTNVANSRTFNIVFGGAPIKVIASDMSKFEYEEWVESVIIAPAERYVVEVLFEEPGEFSIINSIQAIDEFRGEFKPRVDTLGHVIVRELAVSENYSKTFKVLRENKDVRFDIETFRHYFDKPVDYQLELTLDIMDLPIQIVRAMQFEAGRYAAPVEFNDAMPLMNWLSSGEQVRWIIRDPDTGKENDGIHWNFQKGDVVKVRIFNNPETIHPMNHPIHVHGQRYLVISTDGVANENLVWKDTAIVPVGATMDILIEMSNPGEWMLHCHIAEHLHAGMKMSFSVKEQRSSD